MCFDINGIIHPCVRKSLTESNGVFNIKQKIYEKAVSICKTTTIQKGILLCIDGVAPVSKMFQQRYKSVYDKKIYEKYNL